MKKKTLADLAVAPTPSNPKPQRILYRVRVEVREGVFAYDTIPGESVSGVWPLACSFAAAWFSDATHAYVSVTHPDTNIVIRSGIVCLDDHRGRTSK